MPEINKVKWNKTSESLPETDIQCLAIKSKSLNHIEVLYFNDYYKCWDGADGDDVECEIEDVEYWAYMPEFPERS